jgi:hypothetical protein
MKFWRGEEGSTAAAATSLGGYTSIAMDGTQYFALNKLT